MSDNVNIIVQDTINEIIVNTAVTVETIDINIETVIDAVTIIANPNEYIVNVNRIIGEQVQSDWAETDYQASDYIKNKPIIPADIISSTVITGDNYIIELNKNDGSVVPIEFAQSFRHIQSLNSSSWIVTHNLGFRPSVTIIDLDGDTVNGNIIYNTTNQLTLTFAQPIKGEAYLN
jgi:hypothetical protein